MNFFKKYYKQFIGISVIIIFLSIATPYISYSLKDKIPETIYLRLSWLKSIIFRQDFGFYKYEIKLGDQFEYISKYINEENFEFSVRERKFNDKIKYYKLMPIFPAVGYDEINTAYIDFHNDNLIYLTKNGIVFKTNFQDQKITFSPIKSNIYNFLEKRIEEKNASINYFNPYTISKFGIKDLHIDKNEIYISYVKRFNNNEYNTSIIKGEIKDSIIFKEFFSPNNFISSKIREFSPIQAGGKIRNYKKDSIILSVGEFRDRLKSQDLSSVNGKIIAISKKNAGYRIVSRGHRNPLGLDYNKNYDQIISTDMGPYGGDEINLQNNTNKTENFGWPISNYGVHYAIEASKNDSHTPDIKRVLKDAPLYQSHKDYGFIEPIKYYELNPAVAEVRFIKNENNQVEFILSTLGLDTIERPLANHLIHYKYYIDKEKIELLNKYNVAERVRDIAFDEKKRKLYYVGETSGVLGILNLN